jgi:uncharacterized protein (TIGR02996 family)
MSDGEALFRAILAYPDDDTPRLVYADYLDEHGDPRAAIVRAEVEIGRMEQDPLDVFLLAAARMKFAYRGWRRKYPRSWTEALARTVCGEILHWHYDYRPRLERWGECYLLVTGKTPRVLTIAKLGEGTSPTEKREVQNRLLQPLFEVPSRWIFQIAYGWQATVSLSNPLLPFYVFEGQHYLFWDGQGVTEEEAARALFSQP